MHRLYVKLWEEGWYHSGVPLWYKMRCLVRAGRYEAVAMHFRNAYMMQYEEAPDGLLDAYHVRNNIEGVNGHLKEHYGLEEALNVGGSGQSRVTCCGRCWRPTSLLWCVSSTASRTTCFRRPIFTEVE